VPLQGKRKGRGSPLKERDPSGSEKKKRKRGKKKKKSSRLAPCLGSLKEGGGEKKTETKRKKGPHPSMVLVRRGKKGRSA